MAVLVARCDDHGHRDQQAAPTMRRALGKAHSAQAEQRGTCQRSRVLSVTLRCSRYSPGVAQPLDFEARLAALETRVEEVAADAAAARHLAAARDRDLADFSVRVDANRSAINALGEQTAARLTRLEQQMDNGFTEMRGKLDQAAVGQQQIVELLNVLIDQQEDQ